MKKTIAMVALILIGASVGLAQGNLHVPPQGSAERKALMKAIRVYDIARNDDLEGEIFEVSALKVQGNWAFASVNRSNLPEAGGGTHLAFLRKSGAGWKVMWSDYNDTNQVGVDALTRLRKKHKDFAQPLADFAESQLAG